MLGFLTSSSGSKKMSTSQPRGSVRGRVYALNQPNNKVEESDEKENSKITADRQADQHEEDGQRKAEEDTVSGFFYDKLQKEVIALRKICESRESTINAKNEEIKMLLKKVDALTKAIEVETKKAKREAAARDALARFNEESKQRRKANFPRRFGHHFRHFLSEKQS